MSDGSLKGSFFPHSSFSLLIRSRSLKKSAFLPPKFDRWNVKEIERTKKIHLLRGHPTSRFFLREFRLSIGGEKGITTTKKSKMGFATNHLSAHTAPKLVVVGWGQKRRQSVCLKKIHYPPPKECATHVYPKPLTINEWSMDKKR